MPNEFNPLADFATILVNIAKKLPPLPTPPSPPPPAVQSPMGGMSHHNYVDVSDGVIKASTEEFRAKQKAKGLVPFHYE